MDVLIGWPGGDWQATAQLAATLVGGYLFILWATSVLWVYRDIQQRTRDPVSQLTAVAISIVFPLVSLPIYAALRPSETLQDAYLRLLEREVLLSELGTMQGSGEPRRPANRATSSAAAAPAAEVVAPAPAAPAARLTAGAPPVARPARTSAERPRSAPAARETARETPRTPPPREAPSRESQQANQSQQSQGDSQASRDSQAANESKRGKRAKQSNESRSEAGGSDSEPGEQLDEAVSQQV